MTAARTEAKWRDRLRAELADLEEQDTIGEASQKPVTLDQQAVGRLSRMDALQSQAMAKATAQRRHMRRQRITAALERLDAGEFGYCEDCGEDIASGRLDLDPTVTRCISCASG